MEITRFYYSLGLWVSSSIASRGNGLYHRYVSGTIWTDFKPQIENLPNDRLTIVAWDPPGYGKSRPPDRTYPDNFFERDARSAHTLMKRLGYETFSLLGFSDGGITSLILSSLYPDSIRKMILVGANAYILPEELKVYQSTYVVPITYNIFSYDLYNIQIIRKYLWHWKRIKVTRPG